MARTLKSRGLEELRAFEARVKRQHAMKRISKPDAEYILNRVAEIETRITNMSETNEYGKEEDEQWV